MLRNYRTKLLILLALAQVLFLLGIAGSSYAASRFGEQIRIRTVPVDPRDPMYGDYVVLKYEISELAKTLWQDGGDAPLRGEPVYVLLKRGTTGNGGVYEAAGVFGTKPSPGKGEIVLKGRAYGSHDYIQVRYGLEKYYVAENQGLELEGKAGHMVAVVDVAPCGQAVLKALEEER